MADGGWKAARIPSRQISAISHPPSSILVPVLVYGAAAAAVLTHAPDRFYANMAPTLPWRTEPAAWAVFVFFCVYAGAWVGLVAAISAVARTPVRPTCPPLLMRAGVFAVASSILVAIQVLMPARWPIAYLLISFIACAIAAYLTSPQTRAADHYVLAFIMWGWCASGLLVAHLLIHPWFVGQPHFIVRALLVTTPWNLLGFTLANKLRSQPGAAALPTWNCDLLA